VQDVITKVPSHPFVGIPLLQHVDLLKYLAKYVTIKPEPLSKMSALGVPPNVKQLKLLRELSAQSQSTLVALAALVPKMGETINDAIENAAINSGHVTPTYIATLLKDFSEKIDKRRLESFKSLIRKGVPRQQSTEATRFFDVTATSNKKWQYCCGRRFYSVPKGFELPQKQTLRSAFGLWINGELLRKSYQKHPGKQGEILIDTPLIKPFRLLDSKMLPQDTSTHATDAALQH
jgi:hypothetical protein